MDIDGLSLLYQIEISRKGWEGWDDGDLDLSVAGRDARKSLVSFLTAPLKKTADRRNFSREFASIRG